MGSGTVSSSFYQDWSQARKEKMNETKKVTIIRLTKSGARSKMAEDTMKFSTLDEANSYIARVQGLNPTKNIQFDIVEG